MANGLVGMEVVNGSASMTVNGKNTFITNTPDTIINWKQFNINTNELVRFIQENNNSAVFNRVTGDQLSQLKGTLASNGQVFLINPNGIVFGKDSVIDTAGFTASTLNISDKDIKARNFAFEQMKDKAMAQIINNGLITVSKNGSITLIGGSVKNNGTIKVENGNVMLAAGKKVTISDFVNPTITYSVSAPENQAINLGSVFAKNGKIEINAGAVENKGVLNADSLSKDKSGNIIISAKNGEAKIGGTLSATNAQGTGGSITITGKKVTLQNGAHIDLSGKQGGTAYVGGDERGEGKIQLSETTHIQQGAKINVSGTEKGGKAIVWGDRAQIDGTILATGKDKASGGFIETSGHYLGVSNTAKVMAKDWLLDPYNVRIVAANSGESESNVQTSPALTITGDAVIFNSTIETALNAGTNVNITTEGAGSSDGTITVEADIAKNAGAEATLTMFANSTFTQNTGTSIKSTSDKLNVNITAAAANLNGTIDTNEGSLIVNAATGDLKLDGATVSAEALTMVAGNNFTMNDSKLSGNGTVTIGSAVASDSNRASSNTGHYEFTGSNTLTGKGDGLAFTQSNYNASNIGTFGVNTVSGQLDVAGNVSLTREVSALRRGATTNWSANTTVTSGKLSWDERNQSGNGDSSGSSAPPTMNFTGTDVAFTVTNADDSVNFRSESMKEQGTGSAFRIGSNLTVNGAGAVNFVADSRNSLRLATQFYIDSAAITTTGTSKLTFDSTSGGAVNVDSNPQAHFKFRNDNLVLNASGDSQIQMNASFGPHVAIFDGNVTTLGNKVAIYSDTTADIGRANVTFAKDATFNAANTSIVVGRTNQNFGNINFDGNVSVGSNANFSVVGNPDANRVIMNFNGAEVKVAENANATFAAGQINVNGTNDAINFNVATGATLNLNANTSKNNANISFNTNTTFNNNGGVVNVNSTANNAASAIVLAQDKVLTFEGNATINTNTTARGVGLNTENGTVNFNNGTVNVVLNATTNNASSMATLGDLNVNNGSVVIGKPGLSVGNGGDDSGLSVKGNITQTKSNLTFMVPGTMTIAGDTHFNGTDSCSTLAINATAINAANALTISNYTKVELHDYYKNGVTNSSVSNKDNSLTIGGVGAVTLTGNADECISTSAGNLVLAANITFDKDTKISGNVVVGNSTTQLGVTNNTVNVTNGSLTIDGDLKTEGNTTLAASKEMTATGNVTSNGTLTATSIALGGEGKDVTIGENATVNATTGSATLTGNNITNSGNVTAATSIAVNAANNFTNTATGNLVAKTDLTVNATNAEIAGNVSAEGAVAVNATNNATLSGNVTGATVKAEAGNALTVAESANVNATTGKAELSAVNNVTVNGNVTGATGVDLTSAKGDVITGEKANVTATTGNVTLAAAEGNVTNSGTVTATDGAAKVAAGKTFTNTDTGNLKGKTVETESNDAVVNGTVASTEGAVNLTTTNGTLTVNGDVTGANGVKLESENGNVATGENANVTATTGDVALTADNGDITNAGTVKAEAGNVNVTTGGTFVNTETGNLIANKDVAVSAKDITLQGGTVEGANVSLAAEDALTTLDGALVNATTGNVTLKGDEISNGGTVTASNGSVDVDANTSFENTATGNLVAKNDVTIDAPTANIAGNVTSTDGDAVVNATNATVSGSITATDVTLNTTGELNIEDGADVNATTGEATLKGNNITNSGNVTAATSIAVDAVNNFTNTDTGNLKAKDAVSVNATSAEVGGTVNATEGTVDVNATNVTVSPNANISAKENVTLNATNALNIGEGANVTSTDADVALKGKDIENSGTVTAPNGTIDVNATNNFTNTDKGNLVAKEDVKLTAENITNSGNVTSENGSVDVNANNSFENTATGNLKAKENVTIDAKEATVGGNVSAENGTVDVNATNVTVSPNATITAKDDVTLNATNALNIGEGANVTSTDADVALKGKDIENSGTVTAPNGTIDVNATNNFTNTDKGNLVAKEDVTLNANNITNAGNVTSENGSVDVNANNSFENTATGNLKAKENVTIDANTAIVGGNVSAENGTTDVNATNITVSPNATITAKENVTLNATDKLDIGAGANVTSTNGSTALKGTDIENSGTVTAPNGTIDVNATNNFTNTATGNLVAKDEVKVNATNAEVGGNVNATDGAVNVDANNITVSPNATITAKDDVSLTANDTLNIGENATVKSTDGDADLNGANITNSGTVEAAGDINVNATNNFTNTNTGNLNAGNNVVVDAKEAKIGGNVTAGEGNVDVKADNITVDPNANVTAKDDIVLNATDKLEIGENATVKSTDADVTLKGKDIENSGTVAAPKGAIDVNATGNFTNTETGNLVSDKDVKLTAENITNAGNVTSENGSVDVNANNSFENTATGNLKAKENVTIDAKEATVGGNVSAENGTTDVNATNITVSPNATITAKENVTLNATDKLNIGENATVKSTDGDAALKGKDITNSGTVTAPNGTIDVNATNNFTNTATGNLVAKDEVKVNATNAEVGGNVNATDGAVNVDATNITVSPNATITAKDDVTLNATNGTLNIGENATVKSTDGDAALKGKDIINSGTVDAANVAVDAVNNFTNTATGNLVAKENATVNATNADVAGNVTGANATLNTTGNLTIEPNATVNATNGTASLKGENITNSGSVVSPNGAIDVNATNNFTNTQTGNLVAKENVDLKAKEITNAGNVTSDNASVDVNATNNFTNTATGNLKAKENVSLNAADITNAGNVTSDNASVNVNATNNFTNTATGNLVAKDDVNLNGGNITNSGNVTSTDGNVGVNATNNFTNTETGNLKAKGDIALNASDIVNAGNVTSTDANVNVNATNFTNTETGNLVAKENVSLSGANITNSGNVTAENGTVSLNATNNFTNTATGNLKANGELNVEGGDINNTGVINSQTGIANVNGTIVSRGYIGPNYCINGNCGNTDAELAGQLERKDTLFTDSVNSYQASGQEPKESVKAGEITLHRAGDDKTVKLYNNSTMDQEGVSVLSNGSVCSVDNQQSVDAQTINACVKENSRAQGQYNEVFQGKVLKGQSQAPAAGKAFKSH